VVTRKVLRLISGVRSYVKEQYCNCVFLLFFAYSIQRKWHCYNFDLPIAFLFYFQFYQYPGTVTIVSDRTFTVKWDLFAAETTYNFADDNTDKLKVI
jgi:hypothetical protein